MAYCTYAHSFVVLNSLSAIYKYTKSNMLLILIPIDVAVTMDRDKVHYLVMRHLNSKKAFDRLYEFMRLPPLPENMPPLAGIDLWLLTCPCSWGELAWTFYRCQLPAAVIEVKEIFVEGKNIIDHKNNIMFSFFMNDFSFR